MTRKDYILIAEVFRVEYRNAVHYDAASRATLMTVALSLCDSLHRDNPRFDTDHFLAVVRGECDLNSRPGRR